MEKLLNDKYGIVFLTLGLILMFLTFGNELGSIIWILDFIFLLITVIYFTKTNLKLDKKLTNFKVVKKIALVVGIIFVTITVIVIGIFLFIFYESNPRPFYNYYSAEVYENTLKSTLDFKLSKNSKIISQTDSIRGNVWGDYEHRLYCVLELNESDKKDLIKKLKKSDAIVSDTLAKYEFEDSFFMVQENNPLKGLNAKSFKSTYYLNSEKDFQDTYIISFHKNGKIVLFIMNHI